MEFCDERHLISRTGLRETGQQDLVIHGSGVGACARWVSVFSIILTCWVAAPHLVERRL